MIRQEAEAVAFDGLLHLYERMLRFVLRHKLATVIINIGLVVLTAYLFMLIPRDFLPPAGTTDPIQRDLRLTRWDVERELAQTNDGLFARRGLLDVKSLIGQSCGDGFAQRGLVFNQENVSCGHVGIERVAGSVSEV